MKAVLILLPLFFINVNYCYANNTDEYVELGRFSRESVDRIIKQASVVPSGSGKVEKISSYFIDVPYQGSTLIGSDETKEVLTINLGGVDCFTYLDYVEALRHSTDFDSFKTQVRILRYKDGVVEYHARNHFFSDWTEYNSKLVRDITAEIGGNSSITVTKFLNLKEDGTNYLPGIPVRERKITYIPAGEINPELLDKMKSGDYLGIYSESDGLDVSHTGIVIKKNGRVYIRHASSRKNNARVIDEELLGYIKNKPGLVVYRPS